MKTFGGRFDIPRKVARLEEISEMEALEGFWQDADNAAKIQREKSVLQSTVKSYSDVKELLDEFDILHEYASEGDDDSAGEALEVYEKLICTKSWI